MTEVALNGIKKNFGFNNILDGISFEVKTGDRLSIVGKNGCGKTTIFDIIFGKEKCDSGSVIIRNGATIGYLKQIPETTKDETKVKEFISKGRSDLLKIEKKMEEIAKEMENSDNSNNLDKLLKQYSTLEDRFISGGGYELQEKFSKICSGCKISEEMLNREYNELSGGEKTIVNLAKVLYTNPDILLLDEPTNHLDIHSIEWLESFLKNYQGTVLINSHDRYFLDKVTNRTIHINSGKAEIYEGNYSYFLKEDERRTLAQFEDYKNQQKKIEAMKESIKKLRDFGTKANSEMFFKRAFSIQKRLDKMEKIERPEKKRDIPLSFDVKNRSGNDVIEIKNLGIILGDNVILDSANMEVKYGEKVGIIGKNGSGKSTLIRTILGKIEPDCGVVKIGDSVKIGYIPQEIKFEDDTASILDTFRKSFKGNETELRATLARFMFSGENVFKRVGNLSGGEKVKLKLASLMQENINCIILDEPTNHIDINTREILEESLEEYKGTVIFVTHDRYFANKLANRIIEVENRETTSFVGNYDDYKKTKIRQINLREDKKVNTQKRSEEENKRKIIKATKNRKELLDDFER